MRKHTSGSSSQMAAVGRLSSTQMRPASLQCSCKRSLRPSTSSLQLRMWDRSRSCGKAGHVLQLEVFMHTGPTFSMILWNIHLLMWTSLDGCLNMDAAPLTQ